VFHSRVWGSPPASHYIYEYALRGMPNSLSAIAATPPMLRNVLLSKLPRRTVRHLVEKESSLSTLHFLAEPPLISPFHGRRVSRRIGQMICSSSDLSSAGLLLATIRT
jgi:hypothetical protein